MLNADNDVIFTSGKKYKDDILTGGRAHPVKS